MCKHRLSLKERVESRFIPVTESGCWIWLGAIMSNGYGTIKCNRISWQAHRASWTVFRGPIPEGMSVLHTCDIRSCINPDHLFLGNHADNAADMFAKGRENRRDGIWNGRSKLTLDQVEYIRNAPIGCQKLARQFRMDKSSMARIRSGKRWKSANSR